MSHALSLPSVEAPRHRGGARNPTLLDGGAAQRAPYEPAGDHLHERPLGGRMNRSLIPAPAPTPQPLDPSKIASDVRQPLELQQTQQQLRAQRAAWCPPPAWSQASYLVVGGERLPVPFPTRCFDQEPALRLDGPLPWAPWTRQLLRRGWSELKGLTTASGWQAQKPQQLVARLQQPARLRALWNGGTTQLCSTARNDPTGAGVDTLVLHWDGCNSAAHMHDVLRQSGLSAHLLVDGDGSVYQLLDLARGKAFHAGWINGRSIGIELSNPVDPDRLDPHGPPRAIVIEPLAHRGKISARLDFTAAQKSRVLELVDFVQAHFAIPSALPPSIDAQGLEPCPALMPTAFRGVCGHYHVGAHKIDPGQSLWPLLRQHWATQAPASVFTNVDERASVA